MSNTSNLYIKHFEKNQIGSKKINTSLNEESMKHRISLVKDKVFVDYAPVIYEMYFPCLSTHNMRENLTHDVPLTSASRSISC